MINIFLFSSPPQGRKDDENKSLLKKMLMKKNDIAETVERSMSDIARMISHGTSHIGGG